VIAIWRPDPQGGPIVGNGRGRSAAIVAGDVLLHPAVIVSIAVFIANDHVLKVAARGWLTGKISDVAGLVFFPLLLVAAWELLRSAAGRRVDPSARSLSLAVMLTGLAFASIKTTELGSSVFAWAVGTAQWLVGMAWSVAVAGPAPFIQPVQNVRDPTDLVALLGLVGSAAIGLARVRRASDSLARTGA